MAVGKLPPRRHVGTDAHAVDDTDRRTEGRTATEQERVVACAATHRLEPGPHALSRGTRRIGVLASESWCVGEVELEVGEARVDERAGGRLEVVEHFGVGRVEHVHRAAPVIVDRADESPPARMRGEPVGVLRRDIGIGRREERRDPDARLATLGGDGRRELVECRRELVVGVQPVADRRLVAVVDLEHVEGPVGGSARLARMSASVTRSK